MKSSAKNISLTSVDDLFKTDESRIDDQREKTIEESQESLSNEDKRLGVYFLKADEMTDKQMFSEKVIMYLWNDVFTFDKSKIFNMAYATLESILDAFAIYDIRFKVFNSELGFDNIVGSTTQSEETTDGE